jgi:hypothetical protein
MWQEGHVNATTLYYDVPRSEWRLVGDLFDTTRKLFASDEAFVRLGQNREKGCLTIYNHEEAIHLFVDGGFVVCAIGETDRGELALARALALEESTYEWFHDADAPSVNLHMNITTYALKNSIARDIRVGTTAKGKQKTEQLSMDVLSKFEAKPQLHFILVPTEHPELHLKLIKLTNVVGRDEHCDVVVSDSKISRRHCLIHLQNEAVKVRDLDSSHGTFINGKRITDGALKVGDQLGLGIYNLTLQLEKKRAPEVH